MRLNQPLWSLLSLLSPDRRSPRCRPDRNRQQQGCGQPTYGRRRFSIAAPGTGIANAHSWSAAKTRMADQEHAQAAESVVRVAGGLDLGNPGPETPQAPRRPRFHKPPRPWRCAVVRSRALAWALGLWLLDLGLSAPHPSCSPTLAPNAGQWWPSSRLPKGVIGRGPFIHTRGTCQGVPL